VVRLVARSVGGLHAGGVSALDPDTGKGIMLNFRDGFPCFTLLATRHELTAQQLVLA